jgi:cyanophycinase
MPMSLNLIRNCLGWRSGPPDVRPAAGTVPAPRGRLAAPAGELHKPMTMHPLIRVALWAAALLMSLPAAAQGGSVVAAGSAVRDDNHAVWNRIVALAGGPGSRFVVFTASAANPDRAAAQIAAALQAHGALAEHVRVGPAIAGQNPAQAVRDPAWIARVDAASGVYFSGGEQAKLLDLLQPGGRSTPLLDAVRGVFQRGGVVAGESAGAAVMSEIAFREAPEPLLALKGVLADGRETGPGLGFVMPGVVIDQHFLARGRVGRLLPMMVRLNQALGLGVEEGSAAVVRGSAVEVVGVRGVLVIDLAQASHDRSAPAFNVRGARLSYLDAGDRFDLVTRQLTPSPAKRDRLVDPNAAGFAGRFEGAPFHADILGKDAVLHAMALLVDSDRRESFGLAFSARPSPADPAPDLGFEWRFSIAADTLGWSSPASGGDYTLSGVRLDVQPVRMARPLYTPWRP